MPPKSPKSPKPRMLPRPLKATLTAADNRSMEAFLNWLGAGFGVLFVAAVVVAWWEHLLRTSRPPQQPEAATRQAAHVDVHVDALAEAPAAGDAAERQATLDGAMTRMARASQAAGRWTETSPMVLQSAITETHTDPGASDAAAAAPPKPV